MTNESDWSDTVKWIKTRHLTVVRLCFNPDVHCSPPFSVSTLPHAASIPDGKHPFIHQLSLVHPLFLLASPSLFHANPILFSAQFYGRSSAKRVNQYVHGTRLDYTPITRHVLLLMRSLLLRGPLQREVDTFWHPRCTFPSSR